MRRLLASLVGTRPDLDLRRRWWHRLALVVFVLVAASITLAVALWRGGVNSADLAATDRIVTANLLSFTADFQGVGNPAVAFDALDGWLGVEAQGHEFTWFDVVDAFVHQRIICKPEGRVFGAVDGTLNIVATEREGVRIEPMPNHPGDTPDVVKSVCWGPSGLQSLPSSRITRFRPSRFAHVSRWAVNTIAGVLAGAGAALLLALAYYRGFIFVVFGPKRPASG